ncbi:2-dehydropantoate 2-reductase [Streptomyces sp. BK208]|uniref:ketopantoate reductase family protein n=1 Tax=Streptomyces sp. BK208 TaxID=2512150 RepID=UPI00105FD25C|nr:2-dehydropantoate 2-reductase [Streptomyces sp. BK208]TDT42100.1 2-dehydropantoate 2-reductase [Streptomyces sp. BK208]
MTATRTTVAILGPGGVGGLVGALLARAGHRVVCLAGEQTAAVLRRDGLRVDSNRYGKFTAAVEADTELREPVDAVFVTVKQTALADALDRIPVDVLGTAVVVPLLNGIDHLPVLRERFPSARVVAGTVRVEATRTAPGRVAHTSPFADIELAAPADDFVELLRQAGLGVTVRANESAMLWDKLAFLAPFALLTTRHRTDVGAVRDHHRPELLTVLDEIAAVARAAGAPVAAENLLSFFDRVPGTMRSSMQRDAEAGRPLELDAIGGAVLRAGAVHGIALPAVARLVDEVAQSAKPVD